MAREIHAGDDRRRTVLVTGASTGIGAAIASRMAADGADVVGISRSGQSPEGVASITADLNRPDELDGVIHQTVAMFGGLDVVVNNAGAADWREVEAIDREYFDRMISLNLWAPLRICQLAHPYLIASGDGLVVNIGSVDGTRPSAGAGVYGATKAGLAALTVALAKEWAAESIRVVQIDPGLIDTPTAAGAVAAVANQRINLEGRVGRPEEVAGLVAYLASPDGRFVNATQLRVDGGALSLGPFDALTSES